MYTSTVYAHTHIRNVIIDGKVLDRGKCIRPYEKKFNFPVSSVKSPELVCRTTNMSSNATDICDIQAGATIILEFHEEEGRDSVGIDPSHEGPCLVYMAPLSSNGAGNVWFKIFEQGYDAKSNKWCIDTLDDASGKLRVTIPADIEDGDYLLRGEIIALHAASDIGGAEIFPNCVQIRVSGGGSAKPSGVAIPGVYKEDDPGILFDLESDYTTYEIPGPKVYEAESTPNPISEDGNTTVSDDDIGSENDDDDDGDGDNGDDDNSSGAAVNVIGGVFQGLVGTLATAALAFLY
ncbi:hypothetical protein H4R24_000899 [Coemansia sp. RSA 988]|nr:hypothetical protein H4R24_000899 [Coemansia sp. RSA 988]